MKEVAVGRAHRVVHEPRGRGHPEQRGGADREVGGRGSHLGRCQGRRQGGVGKGHHPRVMGIGCQQGLGHGLHESLVGREVAEQLPEGREPPQVPAVDAAGLAEGVVGSDHPLPAGLEPGREGGSFLGEVAQPVGIGGAGGRGVPPVSPQVRYGSA